MGTPIEINDTLKISVERGFPTDLIFEEFIKDPESVAKKVLGREFHFFNKDERLYHRPPTRTWLVQEMPDGKWLYWGHCMIITQVIGLGKTSGTFVIDKLYFPEYQKMHTINEAPKGKSYFNDSDRAFRI